MEDLGQVALLSIFSHLVFIALAWWALQSIRLDKLLKPNHVFQARLLYILLAIIIGSSVSNFFLDYLSWSRQLPLILQYIYNW
ncbi:MAG: rane protein [Neobacillus sp.]|nr:rane protein [Neobacillus sp.]